MRIVFILFLLMLSQLFKAQDPCSAEELSTILSNEPFQEFSGSNEGMGLYSLDLPCFNIDSDVPVKWYTFQTDALASLVNISVQNYSAGQNPMLALYSGSCNTLNVMTPNDTQSDCILGSRAESFGSWNVTSNTTYYIAVSEYYGAAGDFDLFINSIEQPSACVLDAEIEVTARSIGSSLEGPFFPGEVVSICMRVNSYTASGNGCQWYQGMVPVFGDGWSTNSFDNNGQPMNATLNGNTFPVNGVLNSSTWNWWTDVTYHHDNPFFQAGDFDGNGTLDMCHTLYDPNCSGPGFTGGAAPPCWTTTPGDLLPGGWFASGVTGLCPTDGFPTVDWGDGSGCGAQSGTWSFCFDLTIKDSLECLNEPAATNLSIGFFTFADGETGSWNGGPSVCALDRPPRRVLALDCGFDPTCDSVSIIADIDQYTCNTSGQSISAVTQFSLEVMSCNPSWVVYQYDQSWGLIDSILPEDLDNGVFQGDLLSEQYDPDLNEIYYFEVIDGYGNLDTAAVSPISWEECLPCIADTTIIVDTVFCSGGSVLINDIAYSNPGTFSDTIFSDGQSCDTLLTINISETPLDTSSINVSLCIGDSVLLYGEWYFKTGTYVDTVVSSVDDCPTIVTIDISEASILTINLSESFCPGDSVLVLDQWYSKEVTFQDTVPAAGEGCDTVYIVTISEFSANDLDTLLTGVGINTTNVHPRAALQIDAIEQALYLPRLSTTAAEECGWQDGMLIYNEDSHQLQVYSNGEWRSLIPETEPTPIITTQVDIATSSFFEENSEQLFIDIPGAEQGDVVTAHLDNRNEFGYSSPELEETIFVPVATVVQESKNPGIYTHPVVVSPGLVRVTVSSVNADLLPENAVDYPEFIGLNIAVIKNSGND